MRSLRLFVVLIAVLGIALVGSAGWAALPLGNEEQVGLLGGCQHVCGAEIIPTESSCQSIDDNLLGKLDVQYEPHCSYRLCNGQEIGSCSMFRAWVKDRYTYAYHSSCEGEPTSSTPICYDFCCAGTPCPPGG